MTKMNLQIKSEKGQMSIFVVLMFQVLFVLFAMSINVGLVVFDKINLQNSVDLGAYYGAQKQAEMLNVIAHQNYQIRQAWKLFAWRYRVIGQFGLGKGGSTSAEMHPGRFDAVDNFVNEEIYYSKKTGSEEDREYPVVCTTYAGIWEPGYKSQNLCKDRDFSIPSISAAARKKYQGLITSPISKSVAKNVEIGIKNIAKVCERTAVYNYAYAAAINGLFRLEQKARKEIMYSLFYNMKTSGEGFVDFNGESVEAGVKKVVTKNLSVGYTEFNNDFKIEYYNSVSRSGSLENYFNDIKVEPIVLYTDFTSSCAASASTLGVPPKGNEAQRYLQELDNGSSNLISYFSGRTDPSDPFQYSLGLEKNPWYWVYTGVRASIKTRPLFFPFGDPLTMRAVAFAKPFGGRIGPWYKSGWTSGDSQSNSGTLVDQLVSHRVEEVNVGDGEGEIKNLDHRFFPNYSRYPGDELGLRSKLALSYLKNIKNSKIFPLDHLSTASSFENTRDSVVWDSQGNNPNFYIRQLEIAALSPDLFDVTYYSIEPKFSKVYLPKLKEKGAQIFKLGPKVNKIPKAMADLGSRTLDNIEIDANEQITKFNTIKKPEAYSYITKPFHLLTSWLHGEKYLDFSEESYKKKFAACPQWDQYIAETEPIPGVCRTNGGRTGYSVKLISSNLLKSNRSLSIGGQGVGGGPILNPPGGFF